MNTFTAVDSIVVTEWAWGFSFSMTFIPVRPEYSCSLREIVMMESLNDWEFDKVVQFG